MDQRRFGGKHLKHCRRPSKVCESSELSQHWSIELSSLTGPQTSREFQTLVCFYLHYSAHNNQHLLDFHNFFWFSTSLQHNDLFQRASEKTCLNVEERPKGERAKAPMADTEEEVTCRGGSEGPRHVFTAPLVQKL